MVRALLIPRATSIPQLRVSSCRLSLRRTAAGVTQWLKRPIGWDAVTCISVSHCVRCVSGGVRSLPLGGATGWALTRGGCGACVVWRYGGVLRVGTLQRAGRKGQAEEDGVRPRQLLLSVVRLAACGLGC